MFKAGFGRYATFGVVSALPGEIIDSIWHIIDQNLQGMVPLHSILTFNLGSKENRLAMTFSQDDMPMTMTFDLPFDYKEAYPETILAYDDGTSQTILLPDETQ